MGKTVPLLPHPGTDTKQICQNRLPRQKMKEKVHEKEKENGRKCPGFQAGRRTEVKKITEMNEIGKRK